MLAKALGAEIKVLYAQDIAKALTDWCNLAFCDEASPWTVRTATLERLL